MQAPALPHLSNLPLVILSTQAWSDMWVSKHWLASEISRVTPVVFVNPIEYCLASSALPLRHLLEPRIDPIRKTLYSVRLLGLPYHSNLYYPSGLLTEPLAMRQLKAALERMEITRFNLLNFDPKSLYYARGLHPQTHVHYSVDPVYGRENPVYTEKLLLESCDRVIAVTDLLRTALLAKAPSVQIDVVPHALNSIEIANKTDWKRPEDLPLAKVIVGYTGSIHESYVDMALVRQVAMAHPDWAFVFVGSYRPTALAGGATSIERLHLPNVHLLGPRPFQTLKHYIRYFDVCIAPYDTARDQTWDRRSPFKLLHYLAQGKPVVVPELRSLEDVRQLTYQYASKSQFIAQLEAAVRGASDSEASGSRVAFAKTRDFSVALQKIDAIFGQVRRSSSGPVRSGPLSEPPLHPHFWQAPACPCCGERPIADQQATAFLQLEAADVAWQCLGCDLRYRETVPQLSRPERETVLARKGMAFRGYAGGNDDVSAHLSRRLQLLSRRFAGQGRRLLDVGCGTGAFVREAEQRGWQAYGVELSGDVPVSIGNARFFRLDLARMPLPADSPQRFEVIHLNHVLEHVDAPLEMLRRLAGYLAPAGLLVVEVPNELEGLPALIKQRYGVRSTSATSYFQHKLFFSPRSLRRLVEASGLRVLRLHTPRQGPQRLSARGMLASVSAVLRRGSAIEVLCEAAGGAP